MRDLIPNIWRQEMKRLTKWFDSLFWTEFPSLGLKVCKFTGIVAKLD